jgi:hypothetical protein
VETLGNENRDKFRYGGLRLLTESGGRFYLVPVGWRHDRHATYILKEEGGLRIELYAGYRSAR